MRFRTVSMFVLGIVACVLVAWGLVSLVRVAPPSATSKSQSGVVNTGDVKFGGAFTLTDHTGKRVRDTDFHGKNMLVFFGYTFCPDVCPTELQIIARAVDILGKKASNLVPVFITIDPARDTPTQLAPYVAAFHPRLVGMTGSQKEIAAIAKAYKVYARKAPGSGKDSKDYLMDHTSFMYLMGPDGQLRALFRAGIKPEILAREIAARL
ncbi:MAG: SCO family protein [Alphaproteobacteria bacterium]